MLKKKKKTLQLHPNRSFMMGPLLIITFCMAGVVNSYKWLENKVIILMRLLLFYLPIYIYIYYKHAFIYKHIHVKILILL